MAAGLSTMHEEDPSFIYKFDSELKQTIVSGQGELHIDLILERIKDRFGVSLLKSPFHIEKLLHLIQMQNIDIKNNQEEQVNLLRFGFV